jgi:hypothetical protein
MARHIKLTIKLGVDEVEQRYRRERLRMRTH